MSKFKKNISASKMVGYRSAELRKGSHWLVVYYCLNPQTNQLQRFRNRVPKISNQRERTKYAQKMIEVINDKLLNGWSPFFEINDRRIQKIDTCFDKYILSLDKELKDGIIRENTYKNKLILINNFRKYISENQKQLSFISQIDTFTVSAFLDNMYIGNGISPISYNEYLRKINTFFNYCIGKGYIKENPCGSIPIKKIKEKKRVLFNDQEKKALLETKKTDFGFYIACMCIYRCFIRPKEVLMLRVGDIDLERSVITIRGEISKNRKTQNVTIPEVFKQELKQYIGSCPNHYFLIGGKLTPSSKKYSSLAYRWSKFKTENKVREQVQLYSLKDTGITDLLKAGVPAIKVRDQARHSDLSITEVYTTRNNSADETIKKSDFFINK